MPVEAKPAATVIIIRDQPSGPEVLMLKRSGRSGFFPNAWVFPGGRVEPNDASLRTRGEAFGLSAADRAFGVASIRETFEESGVWLGDGHPTNAFRDALNSQQTTLSEATELTADLGRLALWSWWITPEVEPKRYDTRFFVTLLTQDEAVHAQCDDVETVEHRWIQPRTAVAEAEAGTFFLAPPTYLTLCELTGFTTGAEAMKSAANRTVHPIIPKLDVQDGQWTVVLPGDPSYPAEYPVDGPTKVEFREGRWWQL